MPFLKHGGVFVTTTKRYFLGDEVFLLLTLPTLIIGLFGRALIFGALVAVASAFVNLWIWREILAEFAG